MAIEKNRTIQKKCLFLKVPWFSKVKIEGKRIIKFKRSHFLLNFFSVSTSIKHRREHYFYYIRIIWCVSIDLVQGTKEFWTTFSMHYLNAVNTTLYVSMMHDVLLTFMHNKSLDRKIQFWGIFFCNVSESDIFIQSIGSFERMHSIESMDM